MSRFWQRLPRWSRVSLKVLLVFVLLQVLSVLAIAYSFWAQEGLLMQWASKYRNWISHLVTGNDPDVALRSPQETLASFEIYPGYTANLYASEVDFPIGAPVAINFDNRGRLWVANSPTYPHLLPGELPDDSIVILEDEDHDGVADKHTVFAAGLYLPMGFALLQGGALIVQAPDVIFARDEDGDGVMDRKDVVLSGFGTADSHHVISALEWGPDGALYMQDGWFLRSQVETPWGPRRLHDGGVWRFEPDTGRLDVVVSYNFANPWGHVFDDWGQSILCDASGGENYYLGHLMAPNIYPEADKESEKDSALIFLRRGRPTAGCDIVSSANFAAADQGRFMVNQSIGFHGVRWNHFRDAPGGSGFEPQETDGDLLQSFDSAFRPVALEFGPDGALYLLDFYSPVIGHMQFSVRDERRDKTHGRIWRITRDGGPVVRQPDFSSESVSALVAHLESEWAPWRFHARRTLQQMDADLVSPALNAWLAQLDERDPRFTHHRLEALWVYAGQRRYPDALLHSLLSDRDYRARAAAARLYRFKPDKGDEQVAVVSALLQDEHPRVRLEGILNAGQMHSAEGAGLALLAAALPMDAGMEYALRRVLKALAVYGEPVVANGAAASSFLLQTLTTEALLERPVDGEIFAEALRRDDITGEQLAAALDAYAGTSGQSLAQSALEALRSPGLAAPTDVLLSAVVNAGEHELAALYAQLGPDPHSSDDTMRRLALGVEARIHRGTAALVQHDSPADALALAALLEDETLRAELMPVAEAVAAGLQSADVEAQKLALRLAPQHVAAQVADNIDSYDRGARYYPELCGSCHQDDGRGIEGAFPPLAASDWFLASIDRAILVVLQGLQGAVTVNGQRYTSMMAPLGSVADDQAVADVLNYALNSWGNDGGWVAPDAVAALRAAHGERQSPWRVSELDAVVSPE